MCCVYAFKPAPEVLTVEALDEVMSNMLTASIYFLGFIIWMMMSFIEHLQDRIELLEKKQERDDALYGLVQELVTANKIDREIMKKYEERLKKQEAKGNT
jgi:type VI protein secretion system component VasK